jgi:hypothetical protein
MYKKYVSKKQQLVQTKNLLNIILREELIFLFLVYVLNFKKKISLVTKIYDL